MLQIGTPTAGAIAEMMLTNTGSHLLDSGGAYGRNWERNQGNTLIDFMKAPKATFDPDYGVTLDVFHFLNDRLTYSADFDADYRAFDADRPHDGYLETLAEWVESLGGTIELEVNTYNHDSLLSQTLQWATIQLPDLDLIAVQIHGGCDVRGGYTRPYLFTGFWEELADDCRAELFCVECDYRLDLFGGVVDF